MTWHFSIIDWHNNRFQGKALLDFSTCKINCQLGCFLFVGILQIDVSCLFLWEAGRWLQKPKANLPREHGWAAFLSVCSAFLWSPLMRKSLPVGGLVWNLSCVLSKWMYPKYQSLNSELGYPQVKNFSNYFILGKRPESNGQGGSSRLVPVVFSMY